MESQLKFRLRVWPNMLDKHVSLFSPIGFNPHKQTGAKWKSSAVSKGPYMENVRWRFGAKRETTEQKARRPTVNNRFSNVDIPMQFDARKYWLKCPSIREIRGQSSCGSCWAFGAVEAMSDRLCIHSGAKYQKGLSAVDLLSCCWKCGYGCDGGFPAQAWNYWSTDGIVTGGSKENPSGCRSYPFPSCSHDERGRHPLCPSEIYHTPRCTKKCDTDKLHYSAELTKANSSYNVLDSDREIMMEIMNNGPVEAVFDVYEDFLQYEKGIYFNAWGKHVGGHAVCLLGWGEENGVPYWLLANSWNEEWGEDGYFRILRDGNECSIRSDISAGLPDLSSIVW
ncbi:Cathepsin B-like cysteine proteinase [Clonorchis sinensis]|uniref:Cathepsin B-like cysteine proteinase n=1 Tax=Clonorchis sinensis TaxID=79923 RepID=A0A3R7FWW0_CLOSI|nr:Cathepsin B-like cysteine proteinase [Clonorchis sinensis]